MLSKIFTFMKGKAAEAEEAFENEHGITLLEQEIREAMGEINKSKQALTTVVANRKQAENDVASISSEVERFSNAARNAMNSGDEALALEAAEKVSELEVKLATATTTRDNFKKSEVRLKALVKQAEGKVVSMKGQIDNLKATQAVQKAQTAVSSRFVQADGKAKSAMATLERIEKRQAQKALELEAAEELASESDGSDLEKRLQASGALGGGGTDAKAKLAELMSRGNQ